MLKTTDGSLRAVPFPVSDSERIPVQRYYDELFYIPVQQVGLHAKGFEFMRLSKDIEGLVSNYQRVMDGYIAGVPQETLARATTKLADNFDGAIEDLGF
jgi:carnitine monooxygenase subunit